MKLLIKKIITIIKPKILFIDIKMKLTPDWVVGFVDGDGHFGFCQNQHEKKFYFVVSQHKRSVSVLYALKTFFQCGSVHKAGQNMMEYKVSSKKHLLEIIIPFFQKNSLHTSKQIKFEQMVNQLFQDEQLIGNEIQTKKNSLTRDWLIGFIDADGSFVCSLIEKSFVSQMIIGLNPKDTEILNQIQTFLGYGIRYTRKDGTEIFQLSSQKHKYLFIKNFLFTNGNKDCLRTEKRVCARKWSKIILLIQEQQHKTDLGWQKIYGQYINFKHYLKQTKLIV